MQRDLQYLLDTLESAKLANRYIAEKSKLSINPSISIPNPTNISQSLGYGAIHPASV